jgi:drug/metabolite transporter (DMT)-like permease
MEKNMFTEKMAWVILFSGFVASAVSQLIIKARVDPITASGGSYKQLVSDPLIWLSILLILAFVVSWYSAMSRLQVSLMFAWSAVTLPMVAVGAYWFLGEPLGLMKIGSIMIIAVGVAGLALF